MKESKVFQLGSWPQTPDLKAAHVMCVNGIALSDLSDYLASQGFPCRIDGSPDITIQRANTLEDAGEGDISFLSNGKYKSQLVITSASAVIVTEEEAKPAHMTVLRCADPYAAITAAIIRIHGYRQHPQWGQDERASIAATASIGANGNIGPNVSIADGVTIGANATVYAGCYIGDNVTIGDDVILYPNVVIYEGSWLGDRVTLHSGTVVGEDGLDYAPVENTWFKIPPAGRVVIEDDVEMGACCALNKATLGETRIGKGTKFSDGVVIGHGVTVGEDCLFVAQVGVAGSVRIGDNVTLAGQVGVCGHLEIGDNVVVGAKSVVWSSIESGQHYLGNPAVQSRSYRKQVAAAKRLPEMKKRLRTLERDVEHLRKCLAEHE